MIGWYRFFTLVFVLVFSSAHTVTYTELRAYFHTVVSFELQKMNQEIEDMKKSTN